MTQRRARRTYSEEQKKQLVELFNHGKPRSEIIREYDLTASAFDKWVKRINATGSSHEKDTEFTGRTGAAKASQREPTATHGE